MCFHGSTETANQIHGMPDSNTFGTLSVGNLTEEAFSWSEMLREMRDNCLQVVDTASDRHGGAGLLSGISL